MCLEIFAPERIRRLFNAENQLKGVFCTDMLVQGKQQQKSSYRIVNRNHRVLQKWVITKNAVFWDVTPGGIL
jgi:hypothetical protein